MIYTQSTFQNSLNSLLHGKVNILIDPQDIMNRAVREVNGELDLRSTKRSTQISPGIYNDEYTYLCPPDLKGMAIIDVARQVNRHEEFFLTTAEEFDRKKRYHKGLLAFADHDGMRILNVSTELQTKYLDIDSLQTPTDDGVWTTSGDANTIGTDFSNFVYGASSVSFNLASGGTTAVLTNSTLTPVDLTDYTQNEIFIYVYIPLITGLTSFTLKWGSDSGDYYSQTVTTTHEGLSFYLGWNLLRFEWSGSTKTGTPVVSAIKYVQFIINKTSGMAASTFWRVNLLVARIGDVHNVVYYTKYGWQTSAGVYQENSSSSTDLLVADTDEFDLYIKRAGVLGSQELRFTAQEKKDMLTDYTTARDIYKTRYSSERKIMQTTSHEFGSIDGDDDVLHNNWAPLRGN